jgi:antitoxin HicB
VNKAKASQGFHHGSTLDDLFDELGEREEVAALATKRILAAQAARRMSQLGISTTVLARRMDTSRNQILRILDKEDAGITLKMLFRLSRALDLRLRLAFDPPKAAPRGVVRRTRTAPKVARPRASRG